MLELCDSSVMLRMLGKNLRNTTTEISYGKAPIPKPLLLVILEHGLHGNDRITVRQRVFFGRVGQFFVHHHHILGQRDASSQQIVQAVDRTKHPVDLGKR